MGAHAMFQLGMQLHDQQMNRIRRMGMSPRQLEINRFWAFYETEQYAGRAVGWDGRRVLDPVSRESYARTTQLPPGFWDPSGQLDDMPLSMRRPTAPYHLVRAVVNRFTGLLFSAKRHPKITHKNPAVQTWIDELIKACRLWIRMAHARMYGGGQGSVAITFSFQGGRPVIDVHDARWCTPTFLNMTTGEISALEIRYMYPVEEPDQDGILREVMYWYRRTVDAQADVIYAPAPVGEGDEPMWQEQQRVDHGLGEFPGVWIRNTLTSQQDGDPDCLGAFDAQEAIDRLLSQADQGAVENCDPTLALESDGQPLKAIKKGSRNAIQLEKGGGASYLEMTGAGIQSALNMAEIHKRNALEMVQCVLDNDREGGPRTATEIERQNESMYERGDLFREQYGEQGVKPLLAKMIRAAIKVRTTGPVDPATGLMLVGMVSLPPTPGPNGEPVATELPLDLRTFTADELEISWPEWVQRGPADAGSAATAVSAARSAQALDLQSALNYLAPFFNIEDPASALERLRGETGAADQAMMGDIMGRPVGPPPPGSSPPAASPPGAPPPNTSTPPGPPPLGSDPDAGKPGKAQDAALAGHQIAALLELVGTLTSGTLAPDAAAELLAYAAGMPPDVATRIVQAQLAHRPAGAAAPPPTAPPDAAPAGGPYHVGDRVVVDSDKAHMPDAAGPGTVREVEGTALGIEFDIKPGVTHRWYVAREVRPA